MLARAAIAIAATILVAASPHRARPGPRPLRPPIVKSVEAHEIVVIGAGLAGLRCAARLAAAGHDVVVLEAGDRVGGRQRTDEVDGFLLDRGFQVLNPAYPAVGRWVDVHALRMRPFPVGVRVRREHRVAELRHPLRHPTGLPANLRSGLVSPRDAAALARWITPALLRPKSVIAGADRTLRDGWDRVGLRGALRTEVLEPFLAGVLADDTGATSDSFARLLVRMFAIGRPGVPERGIEALPAQLALTATASGRCSVSADPGHGRAEPRRESRDRRRRGGLPSCPRRGRGGRARSGLGSSRSAPPDDEGSADVVVLGGCRPLGIRSAVR